MKPKDTRFVITFIGTSYLSAVLGLPSAIGQPAAVQITTYAQREQFAPPAIKMRSAKLRSELNEKGENFTVGFTTAIERPSRNWWVRVPLRTYLRRSPGITR